MPTRKCACSMCWTQVEIPKRFCEGCLVSCHTIMSAAESLDDMLTADFSNLDWTPDCQRSQTVEHGGDIGSSVNAMSDVEADDGFQVPDDSGDAASGETDAAARMSLAAEAFAEQYAAGETDDDETDDDDDDGGSGSGSGSGGGNDPEFIYVITRRSYGIVERDELWGRGVVGTARSLSIFTDLKSAQKFARPLRKNYAGNKYRCKRINLR